MSSLGWSVKAHQRVMDGSSDPRSPPGSPDPVTAAGIGGIKAMSQRKKYTKELLINVLKVT